MLVSVKKITFLRYFLREQSFGGLKTFIRENDTSGCTDTYLGCGRPPLTQSRANFLISVFKKYFEKRCGT